jgi:hypothetical protein
MSGQGRGHLQLVPRRQAVAVPPTAARPPPLKPHRPAAAVRKSLRTAIARASEQDHLDLPQCLPTDPRKSGAAIARMVARHRFALDLLGELKVALRREADYRAWKRGQAYE